jgi:hypothetical protein
MPAGNWDFHQTLNPNTGRVEWPTGPLTLAGTETATWLEAWVVQSSTGGVVHGVGPGVSHAGASQRTVQKVFAVPGYWTAVGIPPGWIQGSFQAGPALGIALVASRDNSTNTDAFFWWLDVIDLQ